MVGAFAIAAFITPPDITSISMLGIPMCLLYEFGVLSVRWLVTPREVSSAQRTDVTDIAARRR